MSTFLSRREFIKLGSMVFSSVALNPLKNISYKEIQFFGRVVDPVIDLKTKPDIDSNTVKRLYGDTVVEWLREVIGSNPYRINQRWVETPEGYIWSPLLQPVRNKINTPRIDMPNTSRGKGMWVEVSVPFVEVLLDNVAPIAPRTKFLFENNQVPKLYYSQIIWVDQVKEDESGNIWYRLIEPYGSYGERFWGRGEAFRPIQEKQVTPISPEIENKRIEINIPRQTLSCFEDEREIYFCRISSGRLGKETPIGPRFKIFWKLVSVHMAAGSAGAGYDLTGVGWPTFFASGGIAIHSTFWHNDFGVPTSAGCINLKPDDAQFVSRWTAPSVPYDPGMIDIGSSNTPSTSVRVFED